MYNWTYLSVSPLVCLVGWILGWEKKKKKKKKMENRRENGWEWCLIERERERKKWWGPQVFSPPPFKIQSLQIGKKIGVKNEKNIWTKLPPPLFFCSLITLAFCFFVFFFFVFCFCPDVVGFSFPSYFILLFFFFLRKHFWIIFMLFFKMSAFIYTQLFFKV